MRERSDAKPIRTNRSKESIGSSLEHPDPRVSGFPQDDVLCFKRSEFLITTDRAQLQVDRIYEFLANKSYWCLGIPRATVEAAIRNSLCFGLLVNHQSEPRQIGFARIVTDQATFAWLCDVYVDEEFRGKGLSKWLIECVMPHPSLHGLRRICLATKDAQSLYSRFGFRVTQTPGNWMEIKDNDVYMKHKPGRISQDGRQT